MIKAIILDWGRTLYDRENDWLFPEAEQLLDYLSKKYKLAIVSLATNELPEERQRLIRDLGIADYFEMILIDSKDKDQMYEQVLQQLEITPQELAVVDDRVIRGICWGNRKGAKTIWFKKGKFSDELPNEQTGNPDHTIGDLKELYNLL